MEGNISITIKVMFLLKLALPQASDVSTHCQSNSSTTGSMIGGEHFYYNQGHVSSEAGITAGLRHKYTFSADYNESHKIPQERNVGTKSKSTT